MAKRVKREIKGKQETRKFQADVSPEYAFWCRDGRIIRHMYVVSPIVVKKTVLYLFSMLLIGRNIRFIEILFKSFSESISLKPSCFIDSPVKPPCHLHAFWWAT